MFNIGITQYLGILPNPILDGNTFALYDSTDLSTITKDGSNYVSRWNDKLLSGNDLVQITGANQPNLNANGLLFDGVNDYLLTGYKPLLNPNTIYLVMSLKAIGNYRRVLNSSYDYGAGFWLSASSNKLFLSNSNGGYLVAQNANLALNNFGIVRLKIAPTEGSIKVGTNSETTGVLTGDVFNGLSVAASGNGGACSNIQVKEIIVRKNK